MYLMDGSKQIMISQALNESDRLSSCSKGVRRLLDDRELLFNVFSFKAVEDEDTGGNPDEFLLRYNIGGIHMSEAAFKKLRGEISLQAYDLQVPMIWQGVRSALFTPSMQIGTAGSIGAPSQSAIVVVPPFAAQACTVWIASMQSLTCASLGAPVEFATPWRHSSR